jgi:hypothetical protein
VYGIHQQFHPNLEAGRNVMIAAHRNSIRGILKIIDGISTTEIHKVPPQPSMSWLSRLAGDERAGRAVAADHKDLAPQRAHV